LQNIDTPNKILVAIDSSKQAMEAVHYVGALFPPQTTRVVLYHVSEPVSDLFSDFKINEYYQTQLPRLRSWVADEQKHITGYMQEASSYLKEAGFTDDRIEIKITQKRIGIVRDIVKESYGEYDAVVVGRTGVSRFKDYLLKSVAIKLAGKIKHIPVIVMGGTPASKRLCIGFDGSDGAMKGVSWVGTLLGKSNCKIQILSLLSQKGGFWLDDKEYILPAETSAAFEQGCDMVAPYVNAARERLLKAGLSKENVTIRIEIANTDPAERIVDEVISCGFGSVVIARRALVSFFEEVFVGRVSDKVLKKADSVAVWII